MTPLEAIIGTALITVFFVLYGWFMWRGGVECGKRQVYADQLKRDLAEIQERNKQ